MQALLLNKIWRQYAYFVGVGQHPSNQDQWYERVASLRMFSRENQRVDQISRGVTGQRNDLSSSASTGVGAEMYKLFVLERFSGFWSLEAILAELSTSLSDSIPPITSYGARCSFFL